MGVNYYNVACVTVTLPILYMPKKPRAETKQGVLHVTMVVVCVTAMVLQVLCGCSIAAQHGQSVDQEAGVTVVLLHVFLCWVDLRL